jgi:hypothetical protein
MPRCYQQQSRLPYCGLRSKLFFFADAQIQRLRNDDNVLTTVPTQTVRNTCLLVNGPGTCDLSEYLPNNAQAYDPSTRDSSGKNRMKFTNNQIPTSRLSQQAINILKYYPAPNIVPSDGLIYRNNYLAPEAEALNSQQYDTREDYYLNSRNQIFGRYIYTRFDINAPGAFGAFAGGPVANSIGFAGTSNIRNQSLSLGYTRTFSSTAVNEFRYGYYKYNVHEIPGGYGTHTVCGGAGL